jgi:hypothetical protein
MTNREARGAVEELAQQFERSVSRQTTVSLHVPNVLTIGGEVVPPDVGMAVLLDRILALGFEPNGYSEGQDGRTYHYRRSEE